MALSAAQLAKLSLAWFDHRTDIPNWIASGIGRVAAEWSVLERDLEELIRLLMDADIQMVRVATNQINARVRILIATNLMQAHVTQNKLTSDLLGEFLKLGEEIRTGQDRRDMLVHGLWGKHKGHWCTLKLKQSRSTPELMPDLKKLSRAVLPQRELITKDKLRSVASDIVAIAQKLEAFCDHLEGALAPLQHTPPKYTRQRHDYHPKRKSRVRKGPP
jgi:hypothetical protein